jgi:hypothetical protein
MVVNSVSNVKDVSSRNLALMTIHSWYKTDTLKLAECTQQIMPHAMVTKKLQPLIQ